MRAKIIFHTFGEKFSSVERLLEFIVGILVRLYEDNIGKFNEILRFVSNRILKNLIKNIDRTYAFFELYLNLKEEELLREMNRIYHTIM